jgi:hypothetical protein
VVIYTASVPPGTRGAFGTQARIPITVADSGYSRPYPTYPGKPTPLDSGAISSLRLGIQFDPHVLIPSTSDNTSFDVNGAIDPTYSISRVVTANDWMLFDISGAPTLSNKGLLGTVHVQALFSATPSSPINDSVSSSVPWVIWKAIPGVFNLDTICGLGANFKIRYVGATSVLSQNVPNPATTLHGETTVNIPFSIGDDAVVELSVYNAVGGEVARLVDGPLQKGTYLVPLSIDRIPAGVYYYRLMSGGDVQTRTMMIVH